LISLLEDEAAARHGAIFFAKLAVDYPKGRFRGNLGFFGDEAKRYLPV